MVIMKKTTVVLAVTLIGIISGAVAIGNFYPIYGKVVLNAIQ